MLTVAVGLADELCTCNAIWVLLPLIWLGVTCTNAGLVRKGAPSSAHASKYVWRAFDHAPAVNDVNSKGLSK